jgi:exopolysaccharide production protein ExoQ
LVKIYDLFFEKVEIVFSIFSLIFYSEAVFVLLSRYYNWIGSLTRVLYYLIPALTVCLLFIHWRLVIALVVKEKFLWLLIGLTLLSLLWSALPKETAAHNFHLVRVTLFGIYFASRFTLKEQVRLLAIFVSVTTFLSLLFGLLLPEYGIMGMSEAFSSPQDKAHIGAWQGVFTHKNALGRYMDLSSIILMLSMNSDYKFYWLRWIGLGSSVLLILLSTSKTALVILFTLIMLIPLLKSLRWNYSWKIPLLTSLILFIGSATTLLIDNLDNILSALGRDATLSGRSDIWREVLWAINQRPWLGYGYEGFWHDGSGVEVIWNELKFQVSHAHNGVLDVLLQIGLVGTFLFVLTYFTACRKAIALLRKTESLEGLYPLVFLIFTILVNITESSLLEANSYLIMYITITLSLNKKDEYKSSQSKRSSYKRLEDFVAST